MKNILFLCLFFSSHLLAQSLWEILQSTEQNNKAKALEYRKDAQIAQKQAELSYAAPSISLDVGSAKDIMGEEGVEYSLSFSQELQTPFASKEKNSAQRAMERSLELSRDYEYNNYLLDLAHSYHLACVDKEGATLLDTLVEEQKKVFERLRIAYELGEISRKDLLFYHVQYLKLQEQSREYHRIYERSLFALQRDAKAKEITSLACTDSIKPTKQTPKMQSQKHAKLQSLEYERDAALSYYKLAESSFQSLSYALSYDKEIDKKRYGVLVSIPLASLTSKQEKSQVQYLQTQNALDEELQLLNYELEQSIKSLESTLGSSYESYKAYEEQIVPFAKELQELSFVALIEGEGSMIESLDATRSYIDSTLGMLEKKRKYYEELFALYKITDKRLGEIK
jgi:outer membrane protein, heavy metal efflux system